MATIPIMILALYQRGTNVHIKGDIVWSISRATLQQGCYRVSVKSDTARIFLKYFNTPPPPRQTLDYSNYSF